MTISDKPPFFPLKSRFSHALKIFPPLISRASDDSQTAGWAPWPLLVIIAKPRPEGHGALAAHPPVCR